MTALGVNVAGRAEQDPSKIVELGATWARCVAYPDANISDWIRECHAKSIKVLLVLARESIGDGWLTGITRFRDRYPDLIDAWQIGNEADHVSPSSWTMDPRDLSALLKIAREQLGNTAYIVGAGLVSGHPEWAAGVDWSPVNALSCHPYAKDPNTPALNNLIAGYVREAKGKDLWVTEYHARTRGMAAALRMDQRLKTALAFCMTDRMVPGFGIEEDRAAMADFKAAAAMVEPPVEVPAGPGYVLGFKQIADRHPDIIGQPRENEAGLWLNNSAQFTTKGLLLWGNFVGSGDQMGFVADDLTRYVWDGAQLRKTV